VAEPSHSGTAEPRAARDFWLATPASWFELDLDPKTSRTSIVRLVKERSGIDRLQGGAPRQVANMLHRAAREARTNGAVLASMYSEALEGRPVSASLIASVAPLQDARKGQEGPDLEALKQRLSRALGQNESLQEASVVELRAGRAIRMSKRTITEAFERQVTSEVVQYWVPVPGHPQVVALTFSTPNLGLSEPFGELFTTIAESLRWRW
jgi:hypothetical protein